MSFDPPRFLGELRRRRVGKTAAAYGGSALAVALAVSELSNPLGLPDGTPRLVIIVLAIGFPIAIALSWVFDVSVDPAADATAAVSSTPSADVSRVGDSKSVAVLPLANIGGNPENEFYSDGLTEDLIAHLCKVPDLKVISRTSVMQFKNTNKSLQEIASTLGVGMVLEGSVRRAQNRLRVVAQLIDARSDQHVWAETYDRELEDVFEIQSEIALQVAEALHASLTQEHERRIRTPPTRSLDAHEAYLLGWHHMWTATEDGFVKAERQFRRAVELDREYALPYAGLATWYMWVGGSLASLMPASRAIEKAREEAERAIELDPSLGDGYATLAWIVGAFSTDWPEAEQLARAGVERSPNSAWCWYILAAVSGVVGREDECLAAVDRVLELDPLAVLSHTAGAFQNCMFGNLDKALAHATRCEELDDGLVGMFQRVLVLSAMADHESAMEVLDGASEKWEGVRATTGAWLLAYALGRVGRRAEFDEVVATIEDRAGAGNSSWVEVALSYMGVEDYDRALSALERAPGQAPGSDQAAWTHQWPQFKPIRNHPRFRAVLRELGLPDPNTDTD